MPFFVSASCQTTQPDHALRADPALPFLEMAWSPSQMQQFLNHRVLPAAWPGQHVTAVAIEDTAYKPGKECEILYSLQFADPARGQSRWVAVTFANENKLGKIYRHYSGGDAVAQPTPCPVVCLPEYGCLVEFFPRDWALPYLARALEPREVVSLLSEGGAEAKQARRLPKIEVLRYRCHRRCVLRYTLEAPDGSGPQEVIGKVYDSGSLAVEMAQVQNVLHAQAAACGLIIPKPLKVIEEWGLLLMERVPGTSMRPRVKQGRATQQLTEVIGLAAAALASLHRLRFESQEVQSLQTRLEKLHRRAALLHLVAPLLAQEVEALLQQIARLGAHSTTVAPSFVHGDFNPDQLLMDKGRISVVDFDWASLGDPAIDVGNFMGNLHNKAVVKVDNAFRQLAAHFLSEYQARLPEHRVAERVHLFVSASMVRRALRAFERSPADYGQAGSDWLPALLLQEAAACLAGTSDE